MAKRKCPFCKEKVQEKATICKYCRSELPSLPPNQTWNGLLIIMVILGAFAMVSRVFSPNMTVDDAKLKTVPTSEEAKKVKAIPAIAKIEENRKARDEKKLLLHTSYFGNYINAKKQKLSRPRKAKLNVWEPYYTYMSAIGTFPGAFAGVKEVEIEYDEIWIHKDQRNKDLCKFYWLKDKVQAFSLERGYISNPLTGEKFSSPTHKIIELNDQKSIFQNLEEN